MRNTIPNIIASYSLICLLSFGPCTKTLAATLIIPAPPQLAATSYLLVDANSGHVLVEHNSEQRLPPASLTKIMTSFVASTVEQNGTLNLEEEANVSVKAWRMGGSRMFIREGTKVKVADLLRGIVVQSGNDASVALAEHIAGSEDEFVDIMNQQAQLLGMSNTHYVNVSGWPDEDHYSTAADLAKLATALISDHSEHYKLYSEKYFSYNEIRQPNRNQLLWRDKSVDGVKTGHTEAAGYCLVSSALRNGMRLIAVVMGARSEESRATESQKLLTYGFRYYETLYLYKSGDTLKTVRVWGGDEGSVDLGLDQEVTITVPRGVKEDLSATMDVKGVIKAPLSAGQALGKLIVANGTSVVAEVNLIALGDVADAGFFKSMWDAIMLFFTQLFSGDPLQV